HWPQPIPASGVCQHAGLQLGLAFGPSATGQTKCAQRAGILNVCGTNIHNRIARVLATLTAFCGDPIVFEQTAIPVEISSWCWAQCLFASPSMSEIIHV
ncbi:MAG: hypothetical protein KDA85_15880, partial [Planctomycetaceae bacterium]|nr:hypothetical protein [Planctomycetaceae bacterium]